LVKLSDMPLFSGLRSGVNSSLRANARAMSAVSFAIYALPLPDSYST